MKFFTHLHTDTTSARTQIYEHIDPIVNRSRTEMLCSKVFVCRATQIHSHAHTIHTRQKAARRKTFTALSRALIKPYTRTHAHCLMFVLFLFESAVVVVCANYSAHTIRTHTLATHWVIVHHHTVGRMYRCVRMCAMKTKWRDRYMYVCSLRSQKQCTKCTMHANGPACDIWWKSMEFSSMAHCFVSMWFCLTDALA